MVVPPKKTSTPSNGGTMRKGGLSATDSTTGTPSKSPTRTPATSAVGSTSAPAPLARNRSVRSTAPPSARAAARRPTPSNEAVDDDAKAELQAKLEELHEQLRKAEEDATSAQHQASLLQVKLDEALKDQGLLEENVHEHLEKINDLELEKKESVRARREMEQIFESERIASIKEKEESQAREDEMLSSLQRLRESVAQKELRAGLDEDSRPGLQRNASSRRSLATSPVGEFGGQFAPSGSLERSDSRSSSKLVMQKDKIIEELRLELAEAQIKLVEVENIGGGRLQQLEKDMYQTKVQNARLMEENESFQLLLQEKTLNGDLANSELLRVASTSGSPTGSRQQGASLADELEATEELDEEKTKLQADVNGLREQNRALTVYINNIITRLLDHESFEHILDKTPDVFAGPNAVSTRFQHADKDKDLPPPPPEKDNVEPQGFLQRARSVMGGTRPKRPQSQIIDTHMLAENQPPSSMPSSSVHENPQTAPQIPLGRSSSTRAHGHRRANSDWAAANIVNNMYRGPSPGGIATPSSPGLNSPTARTGGFFNTPQPLGPPIATRVPSGSAVPTIPESGADEISKDDPRDSKITQNRNSMMSSPDIVPGNELSGTSSPPRSMASSNERPAPPNSSVMVGSRMRPLRLVQENATPQDDDITKRAANRGSWFGFMNRGV